MQLYNGMQSRLPAHTMGKRPSVREREGESAEIYIRFVFLYCALVFQTHSSNHHAKLAISLKMVVGLIFCLSVVPFYDRY